MLPFTSSRHTYRQHVALHARTAEELAPVDLLVRFADEVQVERRARDEVLRLSDVHPEVVQNHAVQLLVLRHLREDLALDGGWLVLRQERGTRVQECA